MHHIKTITLQLTTVAVWLAGAMNASAAPTVAYQDASPAEVVTLQVTGDITYGPGGVYAGICNLIVDGAATRGFCVSRLLH